MKGSSDTIQPAAFQYSQSLIVTWNYQPLPDGGYEFDYIEMARDVTLAEAKEVVRTAVAEEAVEGIIAALEELYG